jgi:hypothetical protein
MVLPPSFTSKRLILAGVVAVAVILAGFLAWRHWRMPVDSSAVASFLDKAVGGGRVRFSDLKVSAAPLESGDLQLNVGATARAVVPLFSGADPTDYLRRTLSLDPESTAEARQLMAEKDAGQRPEFARLRPFPPDPYRASILQATAQPGDSFSYRAALNAHRAGDGWTFTLVSGGYDGAGPVGEARAAFAEPSYVAGNPDDDARLRVLAADLQAFATRLSETQRNQEAAHKVARAVRREALMARLAPGSVYRGSAARTGESEGTALYLEIAALTPEGAVTARLRNAGGWHYARPFLGTWTADAEYESVVLDLTSEADQAVRNGGSFLENSQAWTLSLRLDPRGGLSGSNRYFEYKFQHLDPGQVASLRSSLSAEFESARRATAPGTLLQGTVVARSTGASEPVLLRFDAQGSDSESLQGSIDSPSRSWKRPFSGTIIGNSRRSGGNPIRLRSESGQAVAEAPGDSVLGDRGDLDIRLGAEEGILSGGDDRYTFRLTAVDNGDLNRLDAARASRADRFEALLREGAAFDGTIRDDEGSVTPARLEISRVDKEKGMVTASIHSLALLYVYQEFAGSWSPADGSMTIASTGRGQFDFSDNLAVPFFVAAVPHTLQLALIGNSISGAIKGDTHWSIEFPISAFLAAPGESGGAAGALPEFPKAPGAYALVAGTWTAMPRNNGHIVVETSHPMTDDEADGGPLGIVSAGVRRATQKGKKTPFLEFDGKEPPPACAASGVVILFNGPAAASTTSIELAAEALSKEGRRQVQVTAGPSGWAQFGEQRVAAYVRRAGPDSVVLTATSVLSPGLYAFRADVGYEVAVK